MYYGLLAIGGLLFCISVFWLFFMFKEKEFTFLNIGKAFLSLLLSGLLLVVTLPSLKYMINKEYDVVKGSCTIEIDSSGRSSEAVFNMQHSSDVYYFVDIPDLDSYGRAVPYYCELTVTKDHAFEIGYKIYDSQSRELIQESK
ncbi:hypothetical protein LCL96_01900 [Rossellomorea aquimaris]|uniref:hypothetical protein n=1 Tax=Rossellomorea aquimaris TaxID=189382 RepID=UPI001CD36EBD|nr:hypothetical protein [Rossellomorea aquimaris]MCA1057669.1 hypothetical protein [Rossellomorea aquimaris]